MAKRMRFLVLAALLVMMPGFAGAAETEALNIVKNDAAEPITPAAAVPTAAACIPDAPPPAGQAKSDNETIATLQRQVEQLQRQIDAMSASQAQVQAQPQIKDMMMRTKNLPGGTYRERCFSCMTMPDEDGERVLSCTCPVGQYGFERLSLNLTGCDDKQGISYCGTMLVCGKCNINPSLNSTLPPAAPRADEQDPGKRLQSVMPDKR